MEPPAARLPVIRRAGQHLPHLDGDAVGVDHHGAAGDRQVVGEDGDVVLLAGVELDDGAAAQAEHLVHRHGRGAEHDRDVERDFIDGCHGCLECG